MLSNLDLIYSVAAGLLAASLLLIGRAAYAWSARFDVEHELTEADNPAIGTALFGYLGGLSIVIIALMASEGAPPDDPVGLAWDLGELAIYGFIAIALLKLSGLINDRFILHRFENKKELVTDRNVGAGAVLCGSYLASGLVLAGALGGRVDLDLLPEELTRMSLIGHELLVSLIYFGIGQIALVVFGLIYQIAQGTNVHDAIAQDYEKDGVQHGGNAAAGIAFGGSLTALGLVMWGGARHDFEGWTDSLTTLGVAIGLGWVLLPVWRVFADKVMLSGADLHKEIYVDRNVNAALLETVCMLALAGVIALLV